MDANQGERKKLALAKAKLSVILLTVAAMAVAGITYAAITVNQNVNSSGTITAGPNVAIYSNAQCTVPVSSISWGSIEAGGTATQTVYVEDTGGTAMSLSINVSNWSPSTASTYINVNWNGQGAQIQPGVSGALAVTFTLTVSLSVTGITSFSNAITISGTG
jgi:hypothetical protein